MTLGETLRRAREKLGKTQRDIGVELGRAQPTVHSWEADQTMPRMDMLADVARAYGLKVKDLLPKQSAA